MNKIINELFSNALSSFSEKFVDFLIFSPPSEDTIKNKKSRGGKLCFDIQIFTLCMNCKLNKDKCIIYCPGDVLKTSHQHLVPFLSDCGRLRAKELREKMQSFDKKLFLPNYLRVS